MFHIFYQIIWNLLIYKNLINTIKMYKSWNIRFNILILYWVQNLIDKFIYFIQDFYKKKY